MWIDPERSKDSRAKEEQDVEDKSYVGGRFPARLKTFVVFLDEITLDGVPQLRAGIPPEKTQEYSGWHLLHGLNFLLAQGRPLEWTSIAVRVFRANKPSLFFPAL